MKEYFQKLKDIEPERAISSDESESEFSAKDASLENIVLQHKDLNEIEVVNMIISGKLPKITKHAQDESEEKRFSSIMYRLGYRWGGSSMSQNGHSTINYHPSELSSEFLILDYVKKNYDSIIEKLIQTEDKYISSNDVALFLALATNKKESQLTDTLSSDELSYIERVITKQNNTWSKYQLQLPSIILKKINILAKKVGSAKSAKYNSEYGTGRENDFHVSFEDIDVDAQNRAELLLKLVLDDPLRGKSSLNENAYDIIIAATSHQGRWYNLKRDPMVHYCVLEKYPKDMHIKANFVDPILREILDKNYFDKGMIAGALIERAYRVEKERGELPLLKK